MDAAYPQAPVHPADASAKDYSAMTSQELQIEAQRLNRLLFDRNGELLEIKMAFQNMLQDLSVPVFAHMNGASNWIVRSGIEAIAKKYVTVAGALH